MGHRDLELQIELHLGVKWICRGLGEADWIWASSGCDRTFGDVDLGVKWICRGLGEVDRIWAASWSDRTFGNVDLGVKWISRLGRSGLDLGAKWM